MLRYSIALVFGMAAFPLAEAATAEAPVPAVVQFNRDVRPVMVNTCFKCHGPDIKANKADLRLDLADNAKRERTDKAGRKSTPVVPGNPGASDVWRRVSSQDPAVAMPPPDSLHLLSARDKEVIRRWIEQGATYEPHWAYIPPRRAEPPRVGAPQANPIDAFILKELRERGISPSPEADKRTLIRRLTLDLTGLPPTVAETEAFVAEAGPGAYDRLVDRLLASPHYGERMAVGWLDLARFADTVGFHGDQQFNNFPYRDYVIDAFNRNLPYDQFVREQLAGDLLPNATDSQRVASGFNRLNMVTREGGAQAKEYIAKYAADRVRTVSTVFLGSTMGCCECHDHKYDPFKSKDFYAMAAYFADITQWGVYADYTYSPEPELRGFNNDFPFPPEIEVDSAYLKERLARLNDRNRARIEAVARAVLADPASAGGLRQWSAQVAPALASDPGGWTVLRPVEATARHEGSEATANASASIRILPDGSVRLEFSKDPNVYRTGDGAVVTLAAAPGPVAKIRMEALPDPLFGGRVTNDNAGGFFARVETFAVTLEVALKHAGSDAAEPLRLTEAFADQRTNTYTNGHVQTSVAFEWRSAPELAASRQSAEFVLGKPIVLKDGDRLVATVKSEEVGRIRFSTSALGANMSRITPADQVAAAFLAKDPTPDQSRVVAQEYFMGTAADHWTEFWGLHADALEIAECRNGRAYTIVTVARTPGVTRVLHRGDWQDESGEVVAPAPPAFLPGGGATPGSARQTRLDLANWIASRDNPLTARAFMNRLWRQFFGTGLSAIVDDLGLQGEYPSHPELLDYLASGFMDGGWDVKAAVRRIVTSSTYRQSSRYRPELAEADPNNRLLARQTPRRLEAEFVRDNALAAGGLINLDVGGPSVYPYQPEGYYAALQFPDRDYIADADERQYRRGVYMHWQRTFLHPMLANFDAPSREECTAARIVSSTPQQALTLLNDPTFVEAARGLAEEALSARPGADFGASLDVAYRRLLARPPDDRERQSLERFFGEQLAYYSGRPDEAKKAVAVGFHAAPASIDPARLAAWTSVARVLLNLNETIVRY
jgi:hypothetical protein